MYLVAFAVKVYSTPGIVAESLWTLTLLRTMRKETNSTDWLTQSHSVKLISTLKS